MTPSHTWVAGQQHPAAKLTDEQVVEIRWRYAAGDCTHRELGREYGVHHTVIGGVIRRARWRHVT